MIFTTLSWFLQPKNAILTAIILAFLGLFVHDRYLQHEVLEKKEEIVKLNTVINQLKSSIELQNQAIKNMNDDFEKQKADFNQRYENVQKANANKVKRIEKQESYVSPESVKTQEDEIDESRNILKEYIINRRGSK